MAMEGLMIGAAMPLVEAAARGEAAMPHVALGYGAAGAAGMYAFEEHGDRLGHGRRYVTLALGAKQAIFLRQLAVCRSMLFDSLPS